MEITTDVARTLAGALLQLTPLLALTLIWTETRLRASENPRLIAKKRPKSSRRPANQKSRGRAAQVPTLELIALLIFMHSMTFSILTIATPTTLLVKAALVNTVMVLALSLSRVTTALVGDSRKVQGVMFAVLTITWFPVWVLVLNVEVVSKAV